jgi:hypothetical protein
MGSFTGYTKTLKINKKEIFLTKDYKRISAFPKIFKKEKFGKIYKDKNNLLDTESQKKFQDYRLDTIYETDEKYNFLNPRDVIQIERQGTKMEDKFIQITYKFKENVKVYIEQSLTPYETKRNIELQLGRVPADNEEINIYEFKRISKWELEKK